MGTKATIISQKIKQKGHFSFSDLYSMCFDYLTDMGYRVAENEYTEKISANGKDIEIDWEASKKVTDYYKYAIKVSWVLSGVTDVEAEQDGKKVKTNKGSVKLTIKGVLETDYDAKWENKPFWQFMRGVYDKYVIRTTTDEYAGGLAGEASDLIGQIKSFLNLGK